MQQSSIIPTLRYQDAPAAIDWLVSVFGFEKHLIVPDENGGIAHATLTLGLEGHGYLTENPFSRSATT